MNCNKNEDSLVKCARSASTTCNNYVAGVSCYQTLNAEVRIVNGTSPHEGLVEVLVNDQWRGVCNNGWGRTEANVTCRNLGYLGGFPVSLPTLGERMKELWFLDYINCNGNEDSLAKCTKLASRTCIHKAGVLCYQTLNAKVRIVNGRTPHEGVVEVQVNDQWRRVCKYWWYRKEATVTCRRLGYSGGFPVAMTLSLPTLGNGQKDIRFLSRMRCQGYENSLLECAGSGSTSCNFNEEAGVICFHTVKGRVRLVNGNSPHEGLVEILVNGLWRSVCESSWDKNEADVTCRSLGYSGGIPVSFSTSRIWNKNLWILDHMDCNGNEDSLLECAASGSNGCNYFGEAGVICHNKSNGTVRLLNGSSPHDGVVEVLVNDRWRSICNIGWNTNEANLTCRLRGYSGGIPVSLPAHKMGNRELWRLPFMSCKGNENSLLECGAQTTPSCSNMGKAAVICYNTSNNTVRLVDGSSPNEGVVEVLVNDRWRRVCDIGWNKYGADVICRNLDYSGGIAASWSTRRESKKETWLLPIMDCNGNEDSLLECAATGSHGCNDRSVGAVICYNTSSNTVRLVNGSSPYEGVVEVLVNDRWRSMCNSGWDKNDADVTCRSLGYSGGIPASSQTHSQRKKDAWRLPEMNCNGKEESLLECAAYGYCNRDRDAGVICYKTSKSAVRLVNGSSPHEGLVEVLVNDRWRGTCEGGWSKDNADVTCRSLGYLRGIPVSVPTNRERNKEIWQLSSIDCRGYEKSLLECDTDVFSSCSYGGEAGVICYYTSKVRLINGSSSHEGFVEVFINNRWRTVCERRWDKDDADVTCRSLGYSGGFPVSLPTHNEGEKDIWRLPSMECRGNEDSLLKCDVTASISCSYVGDAGVICYNTLNDVIRLVNGASSNEGRVEMFINGTWGTVCDDGWDDTDARVVCKSLGYSGASTAHTDAYFGQGSGSIWLDDVMCQGRESSLFGCVHNGYGKHNCSHGDDAGVTCQ